MNRKKPNFLEKFASLDPVMLRGLIVSIFGLLGAVGVVATEGTVQAVIGFVMALLGLVTALLSRPAVVPNDKVLAFKPNPYDAPGTIEAGKATVPADRAGDVATLATVERGEAAA